MRRNIIGAAAVTVILSNVSWAQVDLGGAISGAINGATGNAQVGSAGSAQITAPQPPNGTPPKSAVGGSLNGAIDGAISGAINGGASAGVNPSGTATSGAVPNTASNQGWLGRASNEIRGAVQQADNGAMRLQNNLNPTLQQYGFRAGDQLLDANGQPLAQSQFDQYLQSNPGQMRVLRNGQTVVINGNVQSGVQRNLGAGGMQNGMQAGGRQRLGITMNPGPDSVVVSGVTVGSPAAQAGIKPGDQIISVNGQVVSNPNSMIQLVGSSAPNQPLDLQFRRNGQVMQSQVSLASSANTQGGVYQAGYPQGSGQRAVPSENTEISARLDKLERMMQDLQTQLQQLNKSDAPVQPANDHK